MPPLTAALPSASGPQAPNAPTRNLGHPAGGAHWSRMSITPARIGSEGHLGTRFPFRRLGEFRHVSSFRRTYYRLRITVRRPITASKAKLGRFLPTCPLGRVYEGEESPQDPSPPPRPLPRMGAHAVPRSQTPENGTFPPSIRTPTSDGRTPLRRHSGAGRCQVTLAHARLHAGRA